MADSNRIVFPDEVEEAKAAAKEVKKVEAETAPVETPQITMRNMIQVPANCPAGFEMGVDGVCREVDRS